MPAWQSGQRRCGVLLHPTSLPSHNFSDATQWLDFMQQCGLSLWQVLPLEPPQNGYSPYQCTSAFAMNPALLARSLPVDLENAAYQAFCHAKQAWLDDYALFVILKRGFNDLPWYQWPKSYRSRDNDMLDLVRKNKQDEIEQIKWEQFLLHSEWQTIHRDANQRDILLMGDMPIFVAHDSAEVWANQTLFKLDENGMVEVVAGVPPDYFSETGQRWGNPHYNWKAMQQTAFDWWVKRIQHHCECFDLVRIDHFRGLAAVWEIDADCETAMEGLWIDTPGDELLRTLQNKLGELPLVAEDLGVITEDVIELKTKYGLPGMSVLQFSFDHFEDNPHKPHNIQPNTVCYTGTHDNDTTLGWYETQDEETKHFIRELLAIDETTDIVDAMIDTALQTDAKLVVIPIQDFLKLDSSARMNTPGTIENNWLWSLQQGQLDQPEMVHSIHEHLRKTQRLLA